MRKLVPALLLCLLGSHPALAQARPSAAKVATSITASYQAELNRTKPLYITPDFAFERVHFYFSATLAATEENQLSDLLEEVLGDLATALARAKAEAASQPLSKLFERNEAYLQTARCLLGKVEAPATGPVAEELQLITDAAATATSPVLGYLEDYTQYVPRGHYTKSEELTRYFRTLMWLSRAAFYLEPNAAAGIDDALAQQLTVQALLFMTVAANTPQVKEKLAKLERILTAWIGASDDLTWEEAAQLLGGISALQQPSTALLAPERSEQARQTLLATARRPRIAGTFVYEGSKRPPLSIRLLGQRFSFDSYVFHQLTFDRVLDFAPGAAFQKRASVQGQRAASLPARVFTLSTTPQGRKVRGVPRAFDLLAALGSKYAAQELAHTADDRYQRYAEQQEKLRAELPALLKSTDSFATHYLLAVQAALQDVSASGVNSALGGWILLRHDLAAYAKQSYTAIPKGGFFPLPGGDKKPPLYIAPAAPVFTQLREAVQVLLREMEPAEREAGTELAALLQLLAEHAGKGAVPEQLAAPIYEELAQGKPSDSSILIADVHTDLVSKQVLQVGVGQNQRQSFPIAKGIPAIGFVFQCYEFRQNMQDRLSDKAWQEAIKRSDGKYQPFVFVPRKGSRRN